MATSAIYPTTLSLVNVVLDVPADWDDWMEVIKATAEDIYIWSYMDPDSENESTVPNTPQKPTIEDITPG